MRRRSDSGIREWPRRRGWRIVGNAERYLSVDDAVCRFVPPLAYRRANAWTAELPSALRPVVRTLGARFGDGTTLSDADASLLFASALEAAREHPYAQRWTRTPEAVSSWEMLLVLASALARGMRYPMIPFAEARAGDPWESERAARNPGRMRQWLEGAELLAASVRTLRHDLSPLPRVCRAALTHGIKGVCRHYAQLLQLLFVAAKQTTGRFARSHVLTFGGYAHPRHGFPHAWNLFVEEGSDRIVALDLTGADWLMDRNGAETVLNRGFDAARWNNASSFLAALFEHVQLRTLPAESAAPLLPRLVRPETVRGQALLLLLAGQFFVHPEISARIERFLARCALARAVPGWRIVLRLRRSILDRMWEDGSSQHRLLDSLGLDG